MAELVDAELLEGETVISHTGSNPVLTTIAAMAIQMYMSVVTRQTCIEKLRE